MSFLTRCNIKLRITPVKCYCQVCNMDPLKPRSVMLLNFYFVIADIQKSCTNRTKKLHIPFFQLLKSEDLWHLFYFPLAACLLPSHSDCICVHKYIYIDILKYMYFSEHFEKRYRYDSTSKPFSMYFLKTRTISYLTTVKWWKQGDNL